MARDFDLGITGPPLWLSMDFIAGGLVALALQAPILAQEAGLLSGGPARP